MPNPMSNPDSRAKLSESKKAQWARLANSYWTDPLYRYLTPVGGRVTSTVKPYILLNELPEGTRWYKLPVKVSVWTKATRKEIKP